MSICFCNLFQVCISCEEKRFHIACEDQLFCDPPKWTQWGMEGEQINHERARWLGNKFMEMLQLLKDSSDHFIGKTVWSFIGGNF